MNRLSSTTLCSGLGLSLALLGTTVKAQDIGAVYTSDNAASANHVLVFQRAENGQITSVGSVTTGGTGTGAAAIRRPRPCVRYREVTYGARTPKASLAGHDARQRTHGEILLPLHRAVPNVTSSL